MEAVGAHLERVDRKVFIGKTIFEQRFERDMKADHTAIWGKCVLGRKIANTKSLTEVCLCPVLLTYSEPEEE